MTRNIAIIGSGVTGLSAAWLLNRSPEISTTLFERSDRLGGHTNTVTTTCGQNIDTGFIVLNEATYPNLLKIFKKLDIQLDKTDMSFGISLNDFEYGSSQMLSHIPNLINPRFWRMVRDIIRFYNMASKYKPDFKMTLGDYVTQNHYSIDFIEDHILPMTSAIWSMDSHMAMQFPLKAFVQFFNNHGLFMMNVKKRPQWYTVRQGSQMYIDAIMDAFQGEVRLNTNITSITRVNNQVQIDGEAFDACIFACHADDALALLDLPTPEEQDVLGQFQFSKNTAYLHQDDHFMPRGKHAWSAWNVLEDNTLTYWMNVLQPHIGQDQNYFVSLNPPHNPKQILYKTCYTHPQYTAATMRGWHELHKVQAVHNCYYGGAWAGYGFHEDGCTAGLTMAEMVLGKARPWTIQEKSTAKTNILGSAE